MTDAKEAILELAEKLAMERHGKEFYDLRPGSQRMVYDDALEEYNNLMADRADRLRKAQRENS
jgi:hypothetical protein